MKSADPRKWIDDTDTNKKDGSHRIVMKPVLSFYSVYILYAYSTIFKVVHFK